MAKFLTRIKLNEFVESTFEAENAGEVLRVLARFALGPAPVEGEESEPEKPKRRGRPPKSGVVGVITPAGAAVVHAEDAIGPVYDATSVAVTAQPWSEEAKAAEPDFAYVIYTTLSEISDAIRNYARLPNVGVPGVTSLIREFKTVDGTQAQQVKQIAESEYKALSRRLAELTQ